MTTSGYILLALNPTTLEWDIEYLNGQPVMTDGLETCVLLSIFGKPCAQNGMITDPSERFASTFPDVIARATVSDTTKNDGIAALEAALAYMVAEGIVSKVTIGGVILSAYAILWTIDIEGPNSGRYTINWDKGAVSFMSAARR